MNTSRSKNKELNDYMERFNKNLIQNKLKKFDKDLRAFREGRAYRWHHTPGNFRSRPRYTKSDAPFEQTYSSSGSETDTSNPDAQFYQSHASHQTFIQQNRRRNEKKVYFEEGSLPSPHPEPAKSRVYPGGNKKKDLQRSKASQKITQMAETLVGPAGSTRNKTQGADSSKPSTPNTSTTQTTLSYPPKDKDKEKDKEKDRDKDRADKPTKN